MAKETTIPPHSQVVVGVNNPFDESDGYSCKKGLMTPTREEVILSQQFSVAYMYGEGVDRVIAANATDEPLMITKGTAVAEFHPRPEECFARIPPAGASQSTRGAPPVNVFLGGSQETRGSDPVIANGGFREAEPVVATTLECQGSGEHATTTSNFSTSRSKDRSATAAEFEESGGDGSNAEPSRTKDQGSKLGSSTAERSVCNASTINEADFDVEPLKSVDISHLATERTGEEQNEAETPPLGYQRLPV